MKFILEPSRDQTKEEYPQPRVEIDSYHDDLTITEAGEILRYLLLAWGFHPDNVDELIPPA